jgi:hypothetical protein
MVEVNSPDDPYGCDDKPGRALFDRLGGTQIVRNDGHFGDHDQPYDTFPLLDRLIDRAATAVQAVSGALVSHPGGGRSRRSQSTRSRRPRRLPTRRRWCCRRR